MLIEIAFIILLAVLAAWQPLSRWRIRRRLKLHGTLIEARVTDIKREGRLVTPLTGTPQHIKYEHFLSAEWFNTHTQQTYLFRIKVSEYDQFHLGAPVMILVNPENPKEYQLYYANQRTLTKKPLPRSEAAQDYQQGYQPSPQTTLTPTYEIPYDYEKPTSSYPQQLPEQHNY